MTPIRQTLQKRGPQILPLLAVTCAVCGAKKGEANNWWVCFGVESERFALIGHFEEAEGLQRSAQGAERVNLCGEGCLYRRLSKALGSRSNGNVKGQRGRQTLIPSLSIHSPESSTGVSVYATGNRTKRRLSLRLTKPPLIQETFPVGEDIGRTTLGSAAHSPHPQPSTGDKAPAARTRQTAAIDKGIQIMGQIHSYEPLYVNGDLVGTIEMRDHRLTVGRYGKCKAKVWAKEVEIFGVIEGYVEAERIVIRKNASVTGTVCTPALVIEEGGCFEGNSSTHRAAD